MIQQQVLEITGIEDGKFTLSCPRRLGHLVAKIPGAKHLNGDWTIPNTYEHHLMLVHTIDGSTLTTENHALDWIDSFEAVRANLLNRMSCDLDRNEIENDTRYDHQLHMLLWLAAEPSGLITAGVGTGKTRVAVEHLYKRPTRPSLIVCSNSLKRNWANEFDRWAPSVRYAVVEGTAAQRRKILNQEDIEVFIINYEALKSHASLAHYGGAPTRTEKQKEPGELNRPWDVVIVDEAHHVKDPKSQQTRALWSLSEDSRQRIAMTATPIANHAGDVWSVFRFTHPGLFPSRSKFIDMFVDVVDYYGYPEYRGFQTKTYTLFKELVAPYHFHVDPDDVLDLPPVIREIREVSLPPKAQRQYDMLKNKSLIQFPDMPPLPVPEQIVRQTRLQQIAQGAPLDMDEDGDIFQVRKGNVKIHEFQDLLAQIPETDKVVVFSLSKDLLHQAAEELANQGLLYYYVTGDIHPEERAEAVAAFQDTSGDTGRFFLATLAVASEGITLTAANHCIFLQRSYSLVQNQQAEGRIRRIGQEAKTLFIYDIVTAGTVDEDPAKAIAVKADRLEELLR